MEIKLTKLEDAELAKKVLDFLKSAFKEDSILEISIGMGIINATISCYEFKQGMRLTKLIDACSELPGGRCSFEMNTRQTRINLYGCVEKKSITLNINHDIPINFTI